MTDYTLTEQEKVLIGKLKSKGFDKENPFALKEPVYINQYFDSRGWFDISSSKIVKVWYDEDNIIALLDVKPRTTVILNQSHLLDTDETDGHYWEECYFDYDPDKITSQLFS